MTTETEFQAAKPVPRAPRRGAGRKPNPNPFLDAVREIAGSVDSDGDPIGRMRSIVLNAEHGETYRQAYSRIRRQLTAAGKLIAVEHGRVEPYRIDMNMPDAGQTLTLTFWDRDAGR